MAELPKDAIYHYHSDDGIIIKVDTIPLVRCGECKYFDKSNPWHTNDGYYDCLYWRQEDSAPVKEDDYCSYGQRKAQKE